MLNRAKMTVTADGTGDLTLGGAAPAYQTFNAAGAIDGQLISYSIDDAGDAFEFGVGTYHATTGTFSRTTVQGSSQAGAALDVSTAALVSAVALVTDLVPAVGIFGQFSGNPTSTSWYLADGSTKDRATDPVLWAFAQASGNIAANDAAWTAGQYSPGDGATTFRIPDLRGQFLRGLNTQASAGIDEGRTIGSSQASAFASHNHALTDPGHAHAITDPGHAHSISDPGHAHSYNAGATGYKVNGGSAATSSYAPSGQTTGASGTGIGIYGNTTGISINGDTTGITLAAAGSGTETRPANIAYPIYISRGV